MLNGRNVSVIKYCGNQVIMLGNLCNNIYEKYVIFEIFGKRWMRRAKTNLEKMRLQKNIGKIYVEKVAILLIGAGNWVSAWTR